MRKIPNSPGEILKTLLDENNKKLSRAAKDMDIKISSLHRIVKGKTRVSVARALRFAKYFDTSSDYWITLQNDFDLARAEANKKLTKTLAAIKKIEPDLKKPDKKTEKSKAKDSKTLAARKNKRNKSGLTSGEKGTKSKAAPESAPAPSNESSSLPPVSKEQETAPPKTPRTKKDPQKVEVLPGESLDKQPPEPPVDQPAVIPS